MSYETEVAALTVAVNTVSSLVATLDATTQSAYNIAVATAQTHAGTALAQANIAATQVALATTQKTLATTQATNAAASATTATTQAGIATTQAAAATTAAVGASNIVLGVSTLYPAIRPSLDLDFANGQTVDPRITFTRASTATRTNSKGLIELVPSGVPRIDFDAVTGACKGLLIEEQRTNLFQYSEQADNAYWSKSGTITPDALLAPDGTLTADKLAETSATQSHTIVRAITGTANTNPYTFSRYLKAGEKTTAVLLIQEVPTYARYSWCVFDLSAGTMGAVTNAGGSSGGVATMQAVGNGWYRCSITATLGGTDTSITCPTYPGSLISVYPGTAGAGIFIFGTQLEAGAFPTSYIPTVASQVTRAADVASMTGANFSSWYRADEGSFVVETLLARQAAIAGARQYTVSDGVTSSIGSFYRGGGTTGATVLVSGAAQADLGPTGVISANTPAKISLAYKANDFSSSGNGATVVTDTSGTIPTLDRIYLGADLGGSLNGHIRSLSYYPKRCSNAELVALSTQ